MLSIFISQYLEATPGRSPSPANDRSAGYEAAIYFFCDNRDDRRDNPVAILRGLLTLLLRRIPALIKHILPAYKVQRERLFGASSLESLWAIFAAMAMDPALQRVSCIIDGLDECDSESALRTFLTKLKALSAEGPRLRTILVSREYPICLERALAGAPRLRLDPDHKSEVNKGLEEYINKQVDELGSASAHGFPATLTEKIRTALRERSKGTFLWVSFVLKDLQNKELAEVERCLEELPNGLDNLYARMLNQVDKSRRDVVKQILRWCAFAVRPLQLWKLAAALQVPAQETLTRLEIARSYVAYCGHFVTLAKNTEASSSEFGDSTHFSTELDTVQLVHQSAKDFLVKTSLPAAVATDTWLTPLREDDQHSTLASSCLHCIERHAVEAVATLQKDGFHPEEWRSTLKNNRTSVNAWQGPLLYATDYWHIHLRSIANHDEQARLLKRHSRFFQKQSPERQAWLDICQLRLSAGRARKDISLITVACYLGLDVLLPRFGHKRAIGQTVPPQHSFKDKPRRYIGKFTNKELLLWLLGAVMQGHKSIVRYLLESGAPLNGSTRRFRKYHFGIFTPLQVACVAGAEMVRLLVDAGAKIRSKKHTTPLLIVVITWRSAAAELVKLLLQYGADVRDGDGSRTVFHHLLNLMFRAPTEPSQVLCCLQLLLEAPGGPETAKVLSPDDGATLVHVAARYGNSELLAELLAPKWANSVAARDREGATPLHAACAMGNAVTTKFLLANKDVDHNARDLAGRTPLHIACEAGAPEVTNLLLTDKSVALNARDANGRTPLHAASEAGHHDLVHLLLFTGKFDVNARDAYQRTPLHLACEESHESTVKVLLSYTGIDINVQDTEKETALHSMFQRIMRIQLDPFKRPWRIRDGQAGRIIKALLDAGADTSIADSKGNTTRALLDQAGGEAAVCSEDLTGIISDIQLKLQSLMLTEQKHQGSHRTQPCA